MRIAVFLCLNVCLTALLFSSTITASYAQSTRAGIPQFMPASEWEIKPTNMGTLRGLEALKLPCVMKATYDNGFILRFAGGGKRILSMAADFRQPIFITGQEYNARVHFDAAVSRDVQATAFSDSVLLFNLETLGNIYPQLLKTRVLRLEVEGNSMAFNLGNISEGAARLDACFTGTTGLRTAVIPKSSLPDSMARNRIQSSQAAPEVYSDTNLSRPRLSRPVIGGGTSVDNSPRVAASETTKSMREPRIGGDAGHVLPLVQTPEVRIPRVHDPEIVQSVPQATPQAPTRLRKLDIPEVNQPLPSPVGLRGARVSRAIEDDQSAPRIRVASPSTRAAAAQDITIPTPSNMPIGQMTANKAPTPLRATPESWSAQAGEDMRAVLERWASRADVDLQWEASNNGSVASNVNVIGSFEQAVQTLMAQNATAMGLAADMRQPTQATHSISHASGAAWEGGLGGSKWIAARGASLRETLQSWSVKDGTAFLWKAGREFKVKEPVQNNGDYTQALQELLNQYADDTIRPAAAFNVDPSSGNKLLTVE